MSGIVQSYGLRKRPEGVKHCRDIGKKDMKLNDAMPKMSGGCPGTHSRCPMLMVQWTRKRTRCWLTEYCAMLRRPPRSH